MELDFLYPSEGIHHRWETGYRITSTAATPDQAAFILSIPKRKPMDETQETLRTSAFPSNHVKVYIFASMIHPFSDPIFYSLLSLGQSNIGKKKQEKWVKNLYISSMCYGRTVCWQLCQSSKVKALEFPVEAEDLRDGSRNKLPHIASDCKWLAWPLAISYSSLVVKDHLFAMLYQMWTLPTS